VARATGGWRKAAHAAGLSEAEIERMEPAFEHSESELAEEIAS